MVFVMFWKMLRYQSKKCFADVCLYVVTKRRVVPDNVSLLGSSGSSGLSMLVVGYSFCMSAGFV